MLSPGDQAVVARDPSLPGLAVVLDRERFLAVLRPRVPSGRAIHSARTTYLRYKQGTNCLVGYELRTDAGPVDVIAKAYPADSTDKYRKHARRPGAPGALGPGVIAIDDQMIVVSVFPNDKRLPALVELADDARRADLLRSLLPGRPELWNAALRKLAYKPMRRFVGQLVVNDGTPRAVVRVYTREGFESAAAVARELKSSGALHVPAALAISREHRAIVTEWLPGRPLWAAVDAAPSDVADRLVRHVGAALAELHAQRGRHLPARGNEVQSARLSAAAEAVGAVCPDLLHRARRLARRLARRIEARAPRRLRPIHGDFYSDQVVLADPNDVTANGDLPPVGIIDLDEASLGDPAADLGNFLAHVENHTLRGRLRPDRAEAITRALVEGYANRRGRSPGAVRVYTAAGLFLLAPHTFRRREADWAGRTTALIERCEKLVFAPGAVPPDDRGAQVTVHDRFNIPADPTMTFVKRALDPARMAHELRRCLAPLAGPDRRTRLRSIRATRHKPALRCLIEYQLDLEPKRPGPIEGNDRPAPADVEQLTVIGKIRAKGTDESTFRVTEALSSGPFRADSPDGSSVPPAAGILPDIRMWLQRKVRGTPLTNRIAQHGGVALVHRIAEMAHKLHGCAVPTHRRHSMADELRILHQRLTALSDAQPHWARRLRRLLETCERVGAALPPPPLVRGIHRDFYAEQVLVDEADADRLYLLDLDLYCYGDPALDAGNFIAHLTEQALRTSGDPTALESQERAMEDRFCELANDDAVDERLRMAVRAYSALTLARHVQISSRMPDRQPFVEPLMDVAEERLGRVLDQLRTSLSPVTVASVE